VFPERDQAIRYAQGRANRRFKFNKRRQLFIRMHALSVAVSVSNPDRLPVRIKSQQSGLELGLPLSD
jgi:hypothetical protein